MAALLCTLITVGVINTFLALWFGLTGNVEPIAPAVRALDAIYTAVITGWAIWLLSTERNL